MILTERNRLNGTIVSVRLGSLMAHVLVRIGDSEIESIVTRQSAEEMNLAPGAPVTMSIRSTEVEHAPHGCVKGVGNPTPT